MADIYRGSTPTIRVPVPNGVDLDVSYPSVTIIQSDTVISPEVTVDDETRKVLVTLDVEDTAALNAELPANLFCSWHFENGTSVDLEPWEFGVMEYYAFSEDEEQVEDRGDPPPPYEFDGDVEPTGYFEVTPEGNEDPSEEGWYEFDGEDYVLTEDTEVDPEKLYYAEDGTYVEAPDEYDEFEAEFDGEAFALDFGLTSMDGASYDEGDTPEWDVDSDGGVIPDTLDEPDEEEEEEEEEEQEP